MSGRLILVGTPIGNLGDLSPRAVDVLSNVDAICCEDTRRTGRLLQHAGVDRRPLVVVNDHTEAAAVEGVLERLGRGERVAVVSDAGMPGVADPGERLVRAAVRAGFIVEVVPGPSAAIAAVVASGLPTGRWVFEGFLPRKGAARTERLHLVGAEERTIVIYEAPHRLLRTLEDLVVACGRTRWVAVARELTKLHEEVWRGSLVEAVEWARDHEPRGEMVLVVDGAPPPIAADDDAVDAAVRRLLAAGDSVRDAASAVSDTLKVSKRRAYDAAVRLQQQSDADS